MYIKSQKDFFSGLMFMVVGVAFAWGASTYNIGNGARMGPGYFPLALGALLAVLGGIITFKALVVETIDGERIGKIAWKPLFFIIMANLVFGPRDAVAPAAALGPRTTVRSAAPVRPASSCPLPAARPAARARRHEARQAAHAARRRWEAKGSSSSHCQKWQVADRLAHLTEEK